MKPMFFNTEMVRAILNGRKTVTRRLVKPQEKILENPTFGYTMFTPEGHISVRGKWTDKGGDNRYGENFIKRPYCPGDILYVRETFHQTPDGQYWYKADKICAGCTEDGFCIPRGVTRHKTCGLCEYYAGHHNIKWRPSIHMPREDARIFLRVKDLRVERLRDITAYGCIKEGTPWGEVIPVVGSFPDVPGFDMDRAVSELLQRQEREMLQASYVDLWDSTLKPKERALYGWEANPWVWVIEFERVSREEGGVK